MKFWFLVGVCTFGTFDARATVPDTVWQDSLKSCAGLSDPDFQKDWKNFSAAVKQGSLWDGKVSIERESLDHLIHVSCPAYLANPNGDASLASFKQDYGSAATSALGIKQEADEMGAYFDARTSGSKKYFSQFSILFEGMPCGKALGQTKQHLQSQVKGVENQFDLLKRRCSAIASAAEAAAGSGKATRSKALGAGTPVNVKSGSSSHTGSTITGETDEEKSRTK